jgi:hypothetical protein
LDNEFNWEEGFFEQEEEELYKVVQKIWPIGKVALKNLYFILEINCGVLQLEDKDEYLVFFNEH